MFDFQLYTPTKVVFGRNTEAQVGDLCRAQNAKKVLIHYGSGSVIRSGLLGRVKDSLAGAGISYVELGGVVPNPRLSLVYQGIALAKAEGVDFILAVGGGSVIDSAKAIGYGAAEDGDVWELYAHTRTATACLPIGVVLTLAATGSEMSMGSVITKEDGWVKRAYDDDLCRPKFAIMNPELTYTLPKYQIACGIADIMMHTLERYFIPNQRNRLTDEIAEGVLRTMIDYGRIAVENPSDYDAMSEIMWCGSISHNDLTGLGRGKDFCVHKFGHALSAKFDVAHGASLTTIWGHWADYVYENDLERFQHYAKAVWGIETEDAKQAAEEAIERTIAYFKEIGMPTNLSELGVGILDEETLRTLSMDATMGGTTQLSYIRKLNVKDVYQIFCMANR